jgi:hypothetical protein
MELFCLEDFKIEYEHLISKKAYTSLEKEIIQYFFGKRPEDLLSGTRLNGSDPNPYIKKRLKGSGGYRIYFLLIIKNDCLYLMFVHPKTGPKGASNLTDTSKADLYKKAVQCIATHNLFHLTVEKGRLQFRKTNV